MARKAKKKSAGGIAVKFQPHVTESTPSYYANYVQVAHSPYEFVLTFAKIPPVLKPDQLDAAKKGQALAIEPLLQVDIPLRLIDGLIAAIKDQKEKFESKYSSIQTKGTPQVRR